MRVNEINGLLEDLRKAITTIPVTGIELVREDLQAELAIAAPVDAPLRNRLARTSGNGKAHAWYRLKPTETANGLFLGTASENAFFEKGGLPTSANPSYEYVSAPYVNLGDVATVSFMDQAMGATYTDLRRLQIKVKMINTALIEEWAIINGNSSKNPLVFDGLDVQITEEIDYSAFTPEVDEFKLLECISEACKAIAYAGGAPRLLVCSFAMKQKIVNSITAQFYGIRQMGAQGLGAFAGGLDIQKWNFGWGDVELLPSRYVFPDKYGKEKIFVLDHMSLDTQNNGNTIQMVDLTPIGAVDLALLQTAWRTIVYESTVLMVSIPAFQRKIINV